MYAIGIIMLFTGCIQLGAPKPLTPEEAYAIAQNSECSEYQLLPNEAYYHNDTNTWWIIINKTGPAACMYWCEVYQNQSAKVKMLCSGV